MSNFAFSRDIYGLNSFINKYYLDEYIASGGSKIKFLTGSTGSGKSYFLSLNKESAKEMGYMTVNFSAKNVPLYDFKELYVEIIKQIDIDKIFHKCANKTITNLGYDINNIAPNVSFNDYLSSQNELNAITKKALRDELKHMFLDNPLMDHNFALACSLLTGSILGHPTLDEVDKDIIYRWLMADKSLRVPMIKNIGLAPIKITKINARHMLRSLLEILILAGYKGLAVYIDDLDVVLNKSGLDEIHYTKNRREDMYELIRQLIDDIDSLRNIFFVFAFNNSLLFDEAKGIKSYQALWFRIQNEIVSNRFNYFSDIINLDKYALQFYNVDTIQNMLKDIISKEINKYNNVPELDENRINEIKTLASNGALGIPALLKDMANKDAKGEN